MSQLPPNNSNSVGQISIAPPKFHEEREVSITIRREDSDNKSEPNSPTGKGDLGVSGSTLRNRKARPGKRQGGGDEHKDKSERKSRGNVNFLQMAASLISVMDRVTAAVPMFGAERATDDSKDSGGDEPADDTIPPPPGAIVDPYDKRHPRGDHPIFRAEVGGDVRDPLDYNPEMEKFNIRSDWRRSILAPSFRSDVGYVELPTGVVDEILVWMQTHWKKYPSPEERTILMQELNSTCAMLLRKFNVRPTQVPVLGDFGPAPNRVIDPDFSHQVNGLGAIAVDVGEPLFFASQHPIPIFYKGWPLASLSTFFMLVLNLVLSPYIPISIGFPILLTLIFLFWIFASLSVSKNRHWYYYAFSPELRFQFGSRR